jgi:hypothetical protein
MRLIKFWLMAFLVVVVSCGRSSEGDKLVVEDRTYDMKMVDERMNEYIKFRIPHEFLAPRSPKGSGVKKSQVTLKTIASFDKSPDGELLARAGKQASSSQFRVDIYIEASSLSRMDPTYLAKRYESKLQKVNSDIDGLVKYLCLNEQGKLCKSNPREHYLVDKTKHPNDMANVICFNIYTTSACKISTKYRNWRIQFTLPKGELNQWQTVSDMTFRLLDEFYVSRGAI